jgi:hypothetical protein
MNEPLTTPTSREENQERWRGLVEEQRAGGQSKQAFCRERGISYERFLAWSKRFADSAEDLRSSNPLGSATGSRPVDAFCELRVGATAREGRLSPAAFEIALGGVVVRVSAGFDERDLARLLRVVRVVDGADLGATVPGNSMSGMTSRATPVRGETPRASSAREEAARPC